MFELPKLLITGADGQLGYALTALSQEQGFQVASYDRKRLNICDVAAVTEQLQRERPAYVINAAATLPCGNPTEPDLRVNTQGPKVLASACRELDIVLIQLSCAEVFGRAQESPHREQDEVSPLGRYGESLCQGEAHVREQLSRHIILRTGWLFSDRGRSYVLRLLEQSRKSSQVCVADGLTGSPTSAVDLSRVIMAVVKQLDTGADNWGTYHYCAAEIVSWFGFSEAIIAAARQYEALPLEELVSVHPSEMGRQPRSPYTALDCHKILRDFGIHQRSWRTGLTRVMRNLYNWTD